MSSNYEELKKKELLAALKRKRKQQLNLSFDPTKPKSKPTAKQKEILKEQKDYLHQVVLGGNQSGKSALGGRIVSWFFNRTHPYLDIDEVWGDDPMVIIVCGRVGNQVEELWDKKIKPFLHHGSYREHRQGHSLQYVQNPINGSKIIFLTHHNTNEAREKAQSYVAHLVWLDELTDSLGLIEELQRRVQAKRGRFIMTCTPKLRAPKVKKYIEAETSIKKTYRISMMDNPIYEGRYNELMEQVKALPEDMQRTILFGDWYTGENQVFCFNHDEHVAKIEYNKNWPHIVCVDPAASGNMGYTLWAADYGNARTWYLVDCAYIKGRAPSDMVDTVEHRIRDLCIIKRITDPHEAWFVKEAFKRRGVQYVGPYNKNSRKSELITQLNEQLGKRIMIMPNCEEAIEELSSAQYSETNPDRIINGKQLHVADCMQYFVDCMPPHKVEDKKPMTFDAHMKLANQKRKVKESANQGNGNGWILRMKTRKRRRKQAWRRAS